MLQSPGVVSVAVQYTQSPWESRESQNTGRQLSLGLPGHTVPTEPVLRGELCRGQSNADASDSCRCPAAPRASPKHLLGFQQGRGWLSHGCMLLRGFLKCCMLSVVSRACSCYDIVSPRGERHPVSRRASFFLTYRGLDLREPRMVCKLPPIGPRAALYMLSKCRSTTGLRSQSLKIVFETRQAARDGLGLALWPRQV